MPTIYFVDVPEFRPFTRCLSKRAGLKRVEANGYVGFSSTQEIAISRDETGLNEAVWFGALVAGFEGEIVEFTESVLRIGKDRRSAR